MSVIDDEDLADIIISETRAEDERNEQLGIKVETGVTGPLPCFDYCLDYANYGQRQGEVPPNLPMIGEADEHERRLNAAPWER